MEKVFEDVKNGHFRNTFKTISDLHLIFESPVSFFVRRHKAATFNVSIIVLSSSECAEISVEGIVSESALRVFLEALGINCVE